MTGRKLWHIAAGVALASLLLGLAGIWWNALWGLSHEVGGALGATVGTGLVVAWAIGFAAIGRN